MKRRTFLKNLAAAATLIATPALKLIPSVLRVPTAYIDIPITIDAEADADFSVQTYVVEDAREAFAFADRQRFGRALLSHAPIIVERDPYSDPDGRVVLYHVRRPGGLFVDGEQRIG